MPGVGNERGSTLAHLIETCVYRNMRIGLRRISSRTMQFECTLHNDEVRALFIAASWDLILELPLPAGKFQILSADSPVLRSTVFRTKRIIAWLFSEGTSVSTSWYVPNARTLLYMFKEFNIKSAIKLKTFCYLLNKFRPFDPGSTLDFGLCSRI